MSTVLDYARQAATDDVRRALDWLCDNGFEVETQRGGPHESFGNARLVLRREATRVAIDRDRGQWFVSVRPGWSAAPIPLHVLLTARDGIEPAQSTEFLPVQPPHNVAWAAELPHLIDWVEADNRRHEVEAADRSWRDFIRARLSGPP